MTYAGWTLTRPSGEHQSRLDGECLDPAGAFCYLSGPLSGVDLASGASRCSMAKQRRPAKPPRVKALPSSTRPEPAVRQAPDVRPAPSAATPPPQRRSTYIEAVA